MEGNSPELEWAWAARVRSRCGIGTHQFLPAMSLVHPADVGGGRGADDAVLRQVHRQVPQALGAGEGDRQGGTRGSLVWDT